MTIQSTGKHALIIEDEILIALEVEDLLHEFGFESCDIVDNPADALRSALAHRPDLVAVRDKVSIDPTQVGRGCVVTVRLQDRRTVSRTGDVSQPLRDLAAQQLTQARDRFAAGVASNIEVVQAQDAVAVASEQFIAAQYGYTLAKGAIVRGVGSSEEALRQLLGGSR